MTSPLPTGSGASAKSRMWGNLRVLFMGGLFSKLIAFLLVPVYARTLEPEGFGTLELITITVDLLFPVLSLSLYEGLFRMVMLDRTQSGRAFSTAFAVCLLGALAGVGLIPLFAMVPGVDGLGWAIGTLLGVAMINSLCAQFVRGMGDAVGFALAGVVQGVSLAVFALIFLLPADLGVMGMVLALLGGYLSSIAFLGLRAKLWRELRPARVSMRLLQVMLSFSLPLVLSGALWWVVNSVSRFFLSAFRSVEEVGQFAGAMRVTFIVSTAVLIYMQAWQMSVNEEHDRPGFETFVNKVFGWFMAPLLGICCVISIASDELVLLLLGNEFRESAALVPLLVLSVALSSVSGFLSSISKARMKTLSILYSSVLAAIVVVALNWLLVPAHGMMGAAVAGIFGFAVLTTYRWLDTRTALAVDLPLGKTVFSLVILGVLCIPSFVEVVSEVELLLAGSAVLATAVLHHRSFRGLSVFGLNLFRRGR